MLSIHKLPHAGRKAKERLEKHKEAVRRIEKEINEKTYDTDK